MRALAYLWTGRLPLAAAFWTWGMAIGGTSNLAAAAGSLGAIAAGLPGLAALAVHLLPVPFNVAVAVGVWRSAGHYQGAQFWADLARVAAVLLAAGLTLV